MSEAIETQAVEVVEQDEDQALAAGFAEARGEEPPVIEPVVVEEAAPAAETPPQEEPPEEPQVVFAGLTEDQLRSAILKANEVDSLKELLRFPAGTALIVIPAVEPSAFEMAQLRQYVEGGGVLIEATTVEGDRWVYPIMELQAAERPAPGFDALGFTLTALEGEATFRVIFD